MLQDRIAVRLTPEPRAPQALPTGFLPVLLPRHGERPLGFTGRLLFSAGNRGAGPRCWHEVAVYERADGGLVAAIRQGARLDGLPERSWATACDTPEEVRAVFAAHDPLPPLPLDALTDAPNAGHNAAALLEAAVAQRRLWHALLEAVLGPPPHQTPAGPAPGLHPGDHP